MATSEDNLSRLPDEVLLVIISLLPMKDGIRTSVLSKRWRYLYASRSDLEFNCSVPFDVCTAVVDRVLSYRKSCCINKFSLQTSMVNPLRLEGWINCVVRLAVREITIVLGSGPLLPSNLFTCETLVKLSLRLNAGPLLEVPANVFLPCLKTLSLTTVISFHKDDDSVERLLSNCPALENFECCIGDNECRLVVSSPTLKYLHVLDRRNKASGETRSFEIVVDAPSLDYLDYCVSDVDSHRLINAKCLTDARLGFYRLEGGNIDKFVLALTDLISGIRGVQSLHIDACTLDDCLALNITIPVFHNTTNLYISGGALSSFAGLLYVLTYFESLETLSLKEPPSMFDLEDGYGFLEPTANCLSFRLKKIRLIRFKGRKHEMKMVEYFLRNEKVLEVLETEIYERDCEEELEITKKIHMFPRASDKCKVVVL